jgi:hypothetical protein
MRCSDKAAAREAEGANKGFDEQDLGEQDDFGEQDFGEQDFGS